jgi:hypothetical protein
MPLLSNSPNHFLASLSPTDSDLLRPHLKSLTLPQGTFIYKARRLRRACVLSANRRHLAHCRSYQRAVR